MNLRQRENIRRRLSLADFAMDKGWMRDRQAGGLPAGEGCVETVGEQPEEKHTGRGSMGPWAATQLEQRVLMGARWETRAEKKEHQPVNHTKKSRLSHMGWEATE